MFALAYCSILLRMPAYIWVDIDKKSFSLEDLSAVIAG
jgi:hypothetical protein